MGFCKLSLLLLWSVLGAAKSSEDLDDDVEHLSPPKYVTVLRGPPLAPLNTSSVLGEGVLPFMNYKRVSEASLEILAEHHQSLLEEEEQDERPRPKRNTDKNAAKKYHGIKTPPEWAFLKLRSLAYAEYAGPIGIGEKKWPPGCVIPKKWNDTSTASLSSTSGGSRRREQGLGQHRRRGNGRGRRRLAGRGSGLLEISSVTDAPEIEDVSEKDDDENESENESEDSSSERHRPAPRKHTKKRHKALPRNMVYTTTTTTGKVYAKSWCRIGGHPEVKLSVLFDTGSTNLWMASTLCKSGPCVLPGRHRYNCKRSLTYNCTGDKKDLSITFGTAKLTGPTARDTFYIGPFSLKQQVFGMIRRESGTSFKHLPLDGIVGLGFRSMSAHDVTPFFDNVIKQKVLGGKNFFAFYLSDIGQPGGVIQDGSTGKESWLGSNAILWGGTDKRLYEGKVQWFSVSQAHYWAIDLLDFKIGNKSIQLVPGEPSNGLSQMEDVENQTTSSWHGRKGYGKKAKAIVDSGTTYFTAYGEIFKALQAKMPSAPCRKTVKYPSITFTLQPQKGPPVDIVMHSKDYMVSYNGKMCYLGFMKMSFFGHLGPGMIFGELFIRKYFTIFDRGRKGIDEDARVGFALARPFAMMDKSKEPFIPKAVGPKQRVPGVGNVNLMRTSSSVDDQGQVGSDDDIDSGGKLVRRQK